MSEREIRGFIDRLLRRVVLPTALGTGLALGAGCSDRSTPSPDGKVADAGIDHHQPQDSMPRPEQLPLPYMAPDAAPLHQHFTRG